jgi:hypothetical protein
MRLVYKAKLGALQSHIDCTDYGMARLSSRWLCRGIREVELLTYIWESQFLVRLITKSPICFMSPKMIHGPLLHEFELLGKILKESGNDQDRENGENSITAKGCLAS